MVDAALAERDFEADVAHHRGDNRIARQAALALQLVRGHEQYGIAVDDAAEMIDEQRAIAVTVERHAHPRTGCHHPLLQRREVSGSAVQVDIAAVGLHAQRVDVESRATGRSRGR